MDETGGGRGRSALLTFRGRNIRSFRDEFELSMLATKLAEPGVPRALPWRRDGRTVSVLPAAGVFGANGSGKTNVLAAMDDMRSLVIHSFRSGHPAGGMFRRPFALDAGLQGEPSTFEIDVVVDGVRHEYGFMVDDERVVEEWAYRYPKGRAASIFSRSGMDIDLGPVERAHGRAVLRLLRPNALFLSTAASAGHPVLLPLYEWFSANLWLAEEHSRPARQAMTTRMLDDSDHHNDVLDLLRAADLGIVGAKTYEISPELKERLQRALRILNGEEGDADSLDDAPDVAEMGVQLVHRGVSHDVEMNPNDESRGTLVWFGLVGPVIQALSYGSVLLVDELDASLHPALVQRIVDLFQNPETNPRCAQLIFNSHDTTLMGDTVNGRPLGRDQIWLTEKLNDASTRLYALSDLAPRKEEAVGRRYLDGRYGAVPIFSSDEFVEAGRRISAGAAE